VTGAGMTLTYTDDPVRSALGRLAAFGEERQHRLLDALGQYNENATRLRFRAGVGPSGNPWKPSQRVRKKGGQTLVLSGRLRDSQTHNVLPNNEGVEWGTNLPYGGIHQFGGTIQIYARSQSVFQKTGRDGAIQPRFVKAKDSNFERKVTIGSYTITMPARPYVGVNAQDVVEMETIATRHLDAAAKGVPA